MTRLALLALLAACSSRPSGPPIEVIAGDTSAAWIDVIEHAKTRIEIEAAQLADSPIIGALEQAAHRDVSVQIVVEKSRMTRDADVLARLMRSGVRLRNLDLGTQDGTVNATYVVADGGDAVIGGADAELGARVRDAAIGGQLRAVFGTDWAIAGTESPPAMTTIATALPVALVAEGEEAALLALIAGATQRLAVALPSAPDGGPLVDALAAARARHVEVRVLLGSGALGDGTRHAAVRTCVVLVDASRAWFGTGDWDPGALAHARNVGLTLADPELVAQVARVFDARWATAAR